jgi:5-formyltetrahydrofolate cyclo-ligase
MTGQFTEDSLKSEKEIIRRKIIDIRGSMRTEEVRNKSLLILERLLNLKVFLSSRLVMTYIDFKNEVETRELIRRSIAAGKRVAVPLTVRGDWKNRYIMPCEIRNTETDLAPGAFGILEPKHPLQVVDTDEIDLVTVPGVAFDLGRNRIGFGAGYYDRFLKTVSADCCKIGLAFDIQVMDEIPAGKYDMPLDMIITESRTI